MIVPCVIVAIICLTQVVHCAHLRRALQSRTRYIFAFGDSYSKVDWTYSGTKPSSSNIIGNPAFPGGTTSGGKNWIEYLTTEYNTTLELVYDFAQGGAVVNKSLVNYGNDDLRTQVSKFYTYIAKTHSVPFNVNNSVFAFWFGQNDCYRGYNLTNHDTLYTNIMTSYISLWESLYRYGARNFLILGIGAISKTYLVSHLPADQHKQLEDAISLWQDKLPTAIKTFTANHPHVKYRYIDAADVFVKILNNYKSYGAPGPSCYKAQNASCLWEDHFHPSVEIHNALAKQIASYSTPFEGFFSS